MNKIYFLNGQAITKTDIGKGYYIIDDKLTHDIYKTIDDAKNSINKEFGYRTCIIPKRVDKPIRIIGHMTFKLDKNDKGYYEYDWI